MDEAFAAHYELGLELAAELAVAGLCAALARYGHEEGMANVEREAISGLERGATD